MSDKINTICGIWERVTDGDLAMSIVIRKIEEKVYSYIAVIGILQINDYIMRSI